MSKSLWNRLNLFRVSITLLVINPLLLLAVRAISPTFSLTSVTLILLLLASLLSIGSPVWVSALIALEDFTFLNYFLINPIHTLRIENSDDAITLSVFLFASISVSLLLKTLATKKDEIQALLDRFDQLGRRPERAEKRHSYQLGPWVIDFQALTLVNDSGAGADVHLTPIEWRLLAVLVKAEGAMVSHEQILKSVWGEKYSSETNYLRLYLSQLRKKLEANSRKPVLLVTSQGLGYRANARRVERE